MVKGVLPKTQSKMKGLLNAEGLKVIMPSAVCKPVMYVYGFIWLVVMWLDILYEPRHYYTGKKAFNNADDNINTS